MTDNEAAKMMAARLRGEPFGYVSWKLDGRVVERVVVGNTTVKVPKNAKNPIYSWVKGLRTEQQFAWPINGVHSYFQPYEPWVTNHQLNSPATSSIAEACKVFFKYE